MQEDVSKNFDWMCLLNIPPHKIPQQGERHCIEVFGTVSECSGDVAQLFQSMEIRDVLIKKRNKYIASTAFSLKINLEWGFIQWGKDKHGALGSPHSHHSL